ncbi:MAG TPA: CsgG/HfaB family protein [Lentimicrobium sp.]|nr:CsgG/HfaB family protein [Lentimicrobium sp.]
MGHRLILIIAISLLLVMQSCIPYLNQPLEPRRARLGPETPQNKELSSLPAPKEKIVAAVYKFRDQTGQYKPSETGANWSTAISQGTTAILLRALEESNWFIAIERENISNLLNERKIIRSSRAQYAGESEENGPMLPPLLFAGIILEGGIISYESNILTGGAGLRYFGSGVSGQYREDMVSVYLRAVSTSNGNILKTVYTTKSILSQEVDVGIFRYVKFKRLLEAETGFTYNEPSEMAVTEAIEKAVTALIIEGYEDGLWQFANPADSSALVVKNYIKERNSNEDMDLFSRLLSQEKRGKFSITGAGGINKFDGDYPGSTVQPFGMIGFGYNMKHGFSTEIGIERHSLQLGENNKTTAHLFNAGFRYCLSSTACLTPYIEAGAGIIDETGPDNFSKDRIFALGFYGAGFEWLPKPRLGIIVSAKHSIFFTDDFDGVDQGKYPDMLWTANVGINFYIRGNSAKRAKTPKVKKPLNNEKLID